MKSVKIELSNVIRIRPEELPGGLREILNQRLVFRNPLYGKKYRFGEPVKRETPETLVAIWEEGEDLVIAKGYLIELVRLLHAHRLTPELVDRRPQIRTPYEGAGPFERAGLNSDQARAVREMEKSYFGILEGIPGSGRRLCIVKLAIRKRLSMLVIVHTKAEMYQWREVCLQDENGIHPETVGLLGDGLWERGRAVTIAIAPSLWKRFEEVGTETGLLVIDRCNYASWSAIFKSRFFNCRAQWGVSSGARADGLTRLMEAYIGPRVVRLEFRKDLPGLKVIPTQFEGAGEYEAVMKGLVQDEGRNTLIAVDILEAAARDRRCIVVSDRVGQLVAIAEKVRAALGPEFCILQASVKAQDLEKALSRFNVGKLRILAVPLKSVPILAPVRTVDCFFITAPVKQADYLMQIISKMDEGGVIYEYRDRSPMLRAGLGRRIRIYRRMGIR